LQELIKSFDSGKSNALSMHNWNSLSVVHVI